MSIARMVEATDGSHGRQRTKIFLCVDVMPVRGIDQILSHPSNPALHERYP